jgi:DNA-binding NtrC family response regulator
MVVDDEASVLITYRLILEQQGYIVGAFSKSSEAIRALDDEERYDLVLCDYSLEEQHTGFEVISAARKHDAGIPAALLTGYATSDTAEEAANHKIVIMFKPIEIEEFLATTARMLRREDESNEKSGQKSSGSQSSV